MAFEDIIIGYPRISIILISLIATIFITFVRYFMTDREKMKEIKERQKELRIEMKKFKNNPEKMMDVNQKMLEDLPHQMRESFKPMIITLIPLLLLFGWLRVTYASTAISSSWIWWYIGASIVFGISISKIAGLQ